MATFTGADKAIGFLFDMVSNIAEDYDSTATYAVNDYAIYDGILYKCTSAILVAEDFTPAHWTAVLIMDEIGAGGGGGGSTTLAGLSDVALASVANGDVLTYDSALNKWKNAVGGGGGGESYSTSEQVIGTWTDGRSVYRRVFTFSPTINLSAQSWYVTNVSNSGMYAVLSADVINVTGTTFPVAASVDTGNYVQLFNLRNNNFNNIDRLILKYLRTT